ncbi:MAG TPA: hypothetical protein VNT23_05175 [Gaiellaceae bacterium]|nr:hypothetical protein [Gaiellaceae bacterium]
MEESGWDRELVLTQLGVLADIRANTRQIVAILEEDDEEETEED